LSIKLCNFSQIDTLGKKPLNQISGALVFPYYERKDAFQSIPALRQTQHQNIPAKIMPQVNVEKLLEEDQLFEGIDMPFRFGQDFEVN